MGLRINDNLICAEDNINFNKPNINFNLFVSQASVDDIRLGTYNSFEFSSATDIQSAAVFYRFVLNYKLKVAAGVKYESNSTTNLDDFLPTDNLINAEAVLKYPIGWKIDPYISINANTLSKIDLFSTFNELHLWQIVIENELQFKIWSIFGILIKIDLSYNDKIKPKLFFKQSIKCGILTTF